MIDVSKDFDSVFYRMNPSSTRTVRVVFHHYKQDLIIFLLRVFSIFHEP